MTLIPKSTFTVFLFENVLDCNRSDEACSMANSVALLIILVLGQFCLKMSGIYFLKICQGGKYSIALNCDR